MAGVETDSLTGRELARIFIAVRLTEAERVEEVLTRNEVDYVVKAEPFIGSIFSVFIPRATQLFPTQKATRRLSVGSNSPRLVSAGAWSKETQPDERSHARLKFLERAKDLRAWKTSAIGVAANRQQITTLSNADTSLWENTAGRTRPFLRRSRVCCALVSPA
jgi:hypothetical protein